MFALSNGLAKFQCSISTETVDVYYLNLSKFLPRISVKGTYCQMPFSQPLETSSLDGLECTSIFSVAAAARAVVATFCSFLQALIACQSIAVLFSVGY